MSTLRPRHGRRTHYRDFCSALHRSSSIAAILDSAQENESSLSSIDWAHNGYDLCRNFYCKNKQHTTTTHCYKTSTLNASRTICNKFSFFNFQQLQKPHVYRFWKRWAPENDESPLSKISKIMDVRSISIKKHEMEIWYIFETVKP